MKSTLRKWKQKAVITDDGCWLWTGAQRNGYGRVSLSGVKVLVHRAAYELAFGSIPDGAVVHHKCGQRSCFRPGHLQAITHQENVAESYERSSYRRRIRELEKQLEKCTCRDTCTPTGTSTQ